MNKINDRSKDLPRLLLKQVILEGEIARTLVFHCIFLGLWIPFSYFLFHQHYVFIAFLITFFANIVYYYIRNYFITQLHEDRNYLDNNLYLILVNYQFYLYLTKEVVTTLRIVMCYCVALIIFLLIFRFTNISDIQLDIVYFLVVIIGFFYLLRLYLYLPQLITLWCTFKDKGMTFEDLDALLIEEKTYQEKVFTILRLKKEVGHATPPPIEPIIPKTNTLMKESVPPTPTASAAKVQAIQSNRPNKSIPITQQAKPKIQTISFYSEYKDIIFNLESYTTQLAPSHIKTLKNIIQVIQYVQDQQKKLYTGQTKSTLALIQKHAKQIQLNMQEYLKYDIDQRMRYDRETARIPDFWLKQQLQDDLANLIKEIEFIYQNDLESFIDHKVFLKQRFESVQQDFIIQGKKPKDE